MQKFNIPYYYVFFHFNMIKKITKAVVTHQKVKGLNDVDLYNIGMSEIVSPPNASLLRSYKRWAGSSVENNTIPFHLVSLWTFPLVFDLLSKTGLPVARVVNQGISITINGLLPVSDQLILEAKISEIVNSESKKKLVISVSTSTLTLKDIIVLNLEMSFPNKISAKKGETNKKLTDVNQPDFNNSSSLVSKFTFTKNDGLNYSLLTGDFNPIHWLMFYAKNSPFKTTIMQGFGTFSKISSILEAKYNLNCISIKFLKPVTLPTADLCLTVIDSDNDLKNSQFYLTSAKDGMTTNHIAGQFTYI